MLEGVECCIYTVYIIIEVLYHLYVCKMPLKSHFQPKLCENTDLIFIIVTWPTKKAVAELKLPS